MQGLIRSTQPFAVWLLVLLLGIMTISAFSVSLTHGLLLLCLTLTSLPLYQLAFRYRLAFAMLAVVIFSFTQMPEQSSSSPSGSEITPDPAEQIAQQEKKLLNRLDYSLSPDSVTARLAVYQELAELRPDNDRYQLELARHQLLQDELTAKRERNANITAQFNQFDGSHWNLTKTIKAAMHNPDSYQHIRTQYSDQGDHLVVLTHFRGTNGFGGLVKRSVKARVGINGDVLEIIDQN